MTLIAVRNVPVVYDPPGCEWVKLGDRQDDSGRALSFDHEGRRRWIGKVNLVVFDGSYYAKAWTLKDPT